MIYQTNVHVHYNINPSCASYDKNDEMIPSGWMEYLDLVLLQLLKFLNTYFSPRIICRLDIISTIELVLPRVRMRCFKSRFK